MAFTFPTHTLNLPVIIERAYWTFVQAAGNVDQGPMGGPVGLD